MIPSESSPAPSARSKIPTDPDSLKAWVQARYDSLKALMVFEDDGLLEQMLKIQT